jgi:hypothetical protein
MIKAPGLEGLSAASEKSEGGSEILQRPDWNSPQRIAKHRPEPRLESWAMLEKEGFRMKELFQVVVPAQSKARAGAQELLEDHLQPVVGWTS